jgi:hypothetical protein
MATGTGFNNKLNLYQTNQACFFTPFTVINGTVFPNVDAATSIFVFRNP